MLSFKKKRHTQKAKEEKEALENAFAELQDKLRNTSEKLATSEKKREQLSSILVTNSYELDNEASHKLEYDLMFEKTLEEKSCNDEEASLQPELCPEISFGDSDCQEKLNPNSNCSKSSWMMKWDWNDSLFDVIDDSKDSFASLFDRKEEQGCDEKGSFIKLPGSPLQDEQLPIQFSLSAAETNAESDPFTSIQSSDSVVSLFKPSLSSAPANKRLIKSVSSKTNEEVVACTHNQEIVALRGKIAKMQQDMKAMVQVIRDLRKELALKQKDTVAKSLHESLESCVKCCELSETLKTLKQEYVLLQKNTKLQLMNMRREKGDQKVSTDIFFKEQATSIINSKDEEITCLIKEIYSTKKLLIKSSALETVSRDDVNVARLEDPHEQTLKQLRKTHEKLKKYRKQVTRLKQKLNQIQEAKSVTKRRTVQTSPRYFLQKPRSAQSSFKETDTHNSFTAEENDFGIEESNKSDLEVMSEASFNNNYEKVLRKLEAQNSLKVKTLKHELVQTKHKMKRLNELNLKLEKQLREFVESNKENERHENGLKKQTRALKKKSRETERQKRQSLGPELLSKLEQKISIQRNEISRLKVALDQEREERKIKAKKPKEANSHSHWLKLKKLQLSKDMIEKDLKLKEENIKEMSKRYALLEKTKLKVETQLAENDKESKLFKAKMKKIKQGLTIDDLRGLQDMKAMEFNFKLSYLSLQKENDTMKNKNILLKNVLKAVRNVENKGMSLKGAARFLRKGSDKADVDLFLENIKQVIQKLRNKYFKSKKMLKEIKLSKKNYQKVKDFNEVEKNIYQEKINFLQALVNTKIREPNSYEKNSILSQNKTCSTHPIPSLSSLKRKANFKTKMAAKVHPLSELKVKIVQRNVSVQSENSLTSSNPKETSAISTNSNISEKIALPTKLKNASSSTVAMLETETFDKSLGTQESSVCKESVSSGAVTNSSVENINEELVFVKLKNDVLRSQLNEKDEKYKMQIKDLMRENGKLKNELSAFDIEFFEEIEDLKYKYHQLLKKQSD